MQQDDARAPGARVSVGEPMGPTVAPENCRVMAEVRAEIDRIDRELVRLVAERSRYIAAAARVKERAEDVRVEWRIAEVIEKVRVEAAAQNLPIRIAEPVWRLLVEESIAFEADEWRRLRGGGQENT